jgi:ABC-type antimicrobial peptide transport system permease subunit
MTFRELLKKDLFFYRRTNLTLIGLAAVCCAILTGSLLVGDSVRYSLRRLGEMRLGRTQWAMSTGDRYFRQSLAEQLADQTQLPTAAVLHRKGILESADGEIRINEVMIYGVDERFWELSESSQPPVPELKVNSVRLSAAAAQRIGDKKKDWLLRFETEQFLSSELIFTKDQPASRAWPVTVAGQVADEAMGRFGLTARQQAPLNVFVPIEWLAEKTQVPQQANILLVGSNPKKRSDAAELNTRLRQSLDAGDLQLEFRTIQSAGVIELSSPRIFLETAVSETAQKAGTQAYGVFTYFVNDIRSGDKSVAYSMVSAAGAEGGMTLAAGLKDDEIILNEWLAGELNADTGATVTLTYYKPVTAAKLIEETAAFKVVSVAPMMGLFADSTLMPAFPGLADAESCRDWDAGVPIDLSRIGDRDEAYWNKYKGTPKAFISLAAARRLWTNRFGGLTAVRWPVKGNTIETLQADLLQKIDPAAMGFVFDDVQASVRAQASGSSDFAGLFAGLSMFLIFSAAVLLALVFMFYIEARSAQAGLLLAVGWDRTRVVLFFMAEGTIPAGLGCAAGAAVSMVYTKVFVAILNSTFWTNAVASLHLVSHATVFTLIKGTVISFLICVLAMQLGLFSRIRRPVHQLLTGTAELKTIRRAGRWSRLSAAAGLLIAAGLILPLDSGAKSQTAMFFMAGTLLLAGMFCGAAALLKRLRSQSGSFARSQVKLAIRNIPRRIGRSLAVLMTAACGVFLVVSIGANHKDVGADAQERRSGTGGFTLMAQTTLPLKAAPTLAADDGLRMPGIEPTASAAFKVYQQEDASCLNLNRVRQPTILGVVPEKLARREAFSFQSMLDDDRLEGWRLLEAKLEENEIPVIGDYATVYWALGKNTGDTLEYETETGRVVLKVVGVLKDSLLQGRLFVSQQDFERMFPSVDGYQLFLIDADWANRQLQAQQLSKRYRDAGMEATEAVQILAGFHEVENTYLAIFLALGGLGLVLGSAALGLVLLLNVLDRRGELAMMQAVGFRRQDLQFMLFVEHGVLLAAGVMCGLGPAIYAVLPALWIQGRDFPGPAAVLLTAAMLAAGAVWIRLAIAGVLKMNFLDVLKNE